MIFFRESKWDLILYRRQRMDYENVGEGMNLSEDFVKFRKEILFIKSHIFASFSLSKMKPMYAIDFSEKGIFF